VDAAHILVDTASNINLIISNAYDSGFRKIYFQEGLYLVNEPIDLSNKTYLKIEGAGSGTVFKPAIGYDLASYLFNLQNVERLLLNDFSIDLKTSTSNFGKLGKSDIFISSPYRYSLFSNKISLSTSFPQTSQPSVFSLANNSTRGNSPIKSSINFLTSKGFWLCLVLIASNICFIFFTFL
jgi:hypothetical protein